MGKCKVIPFRQPRQQRKLGLIERLLLKCGLKGSRAGKNERTVVHGFGPGAMRSTRGN
ncbi:hypothetical protein Pcar_3303 [Syntrophotalea carbinolica DSM 2380]|uniref:Uncharacterized protein n=1 Tax=Syntrophotalea carbinolica (strain DSM 2380 / NBRC 103641 / GraBd1) TaxID=338963 RepID=Q0C6L5_SYNC1|nr:hypothetical protein [Syntrophotalea carbinolica]ABI81922.1 hypothetical protein Pcar_3303 [Syntrophotalea carbinolica DSM 2380]